MPIRIPRGWEIPERQATPEHLVFGRRKAFGLGAGLLADIAAGAGSGADGRFALNGEKARIVGHLETGFGGVADPPGDDCGHFNRVAGHVVDL